MFTIGPAIKWVAIVVALGIVGKGLHFTWNWHLTEVENAIENTKKDLIADQNELIIKVELQAKEKNRLERERIQKELKVERAKVNDLRRMLLIDHDLDRLLQRKPGLILTRVNKGTEQYFADLEEITK